MSGIGTGVSWLIEKAFEYRICVGSSPFLTFAVLLCSMICQSQHFPQMEKFSRPSMHRRQWTAAGNSIFQYDGFPLLILVLHSSDVPSFPGLLLVFAAKMESSW